MTKEENILRIKATALNKIRKLYNPKTKHKQFYLKLFKQKSSIRL